MIRAPATIPAIPGLQTALDGKYPMTGGLLSGGLTSYAISGIAVARVVVHDSAALVRYTYPGPYNGLAVPSSGSVWWTSGNWQDIGDVYLLRDDAAVLALRNGLNQQTLRVYGTHSGAGANYARASLSSSSTDITLSAQAGGTAGPNLDLKLIPAGTGKVSVSAPLTLKGYTVITLPAGTKGDTAFVTDAAAPTFLSVVAGGGSVVTKVFFNGTSWICQ